MNVTILGTGYVGLTTGVCLAYLGHKVTCVDPDESKIAALCRGEAPFHEPFLAELIACARQNLAFTTEYADAIPAAEVIFIAVGTPPGKGGNPDLRYLKAAASGIGEHLGKGYTVVVNKSTVPIGSANWVQSLVREAAAGNGQSPCFAVASNPEFLREGSALFDTLFPDRVVIGASDPKAAEVLKELYRPMLDQSFAAPAFLPRPDELKPGADAVTLISTDPASAELIKYGANAFLALKISYINEVGALAGKVGANIRDVAKGVGMDARIGSRFLQAGIGWGGSCFPKDTAALVATAAEYGLHMQIVQAARDVNARQRQRVVGELLTELKTLKGRTIGVLGLSFKPDTDDLRDAPAIEIMQALLDRGVRIKAHDPVAMKRFQEEQPEMDVIMCSSAAEVASGADALVLTTEWPEYRDLDWDALGKAMHSPVLMDGRNLLDSDAMRKAGFHYLTLSS